MKTKKSCENCGRMVKELFRNKNFEYVCKKCKGDVGEKGKRFTLSEALLKVYQVKGYSYWKHGVINTPEVLVGKKVVLLLVKDKNDN